MLSSSTSNTSIQNVKQNNNVAPTNFVNKTGIFGSMSLLLVVCILTFCSGTFAFIEMGRYIKNTEYDIYNP